MSRPILLALLLVTTACRSAPSSTDKDGSLDDQDDGLATDEDGDGLAGDDDCDETDPAVHAGATEVCNGVDDNCDGQIDEGLESTWFTDADGDGFGDPSTENTACSAPSSDSVDNGEDCDDTDAEVHPAALETCNERDDDCDSLVDEDVTTLFYADSDGDGYGDLESPTEACEAPANHVDSSLANDCDDTEPDVFPGNPEVCDELDNNCDGTVDEGVTTTFYVDLDGDAWGDLGATTQACAEPDGYATDPGDCDDTDDAVHPGATEVCNGLDDDCDGDIDDDDPSLDSSTGGTFYADADADGFGDAGATSAACDAPTGTVTDATDCDDTNGAVNPAATEVCNSIDDDCDGDIDDDDSTLDLSTATAFYDDDDGDGYGDVGDLTTVCDQPTGTVTDATDCDDTEAAVNPGATEVCNSVDDDCDGDIDDDDSSLDTSTATTWYADLDTDGYGDADDSMLTCDQPSSYVADDTDCDDTDSSVNPGATEVWYDGIDADCDAADDYDADGDGDPSEDHGGTDCDDDDASVYGGSGCRPVVTCTHASPTTLATYDPSGISDIAFDDDCEAWLPTLISGTDYVYSMDSSGSTTRYTGTSNHNIGSIALDPNSTAFAVGYSNVNYVGYSSGTSIPVIATSSSVNGSSWSNGYLNNSPASIAMDSSGCIWVPNFSGSGTLDCIETDGTENNVLTGLSYIESVGLDATETVHIAVGDTIYSVDTATSTTTSVYVAGDTVLDFVFDYNDDLYVETDSREIELAPGDGSTSSVFATVSGEGKLAISPDGWLVRIIPNPVGAASYEDFELD